MVWDPGEVTGVTGGVGDVDGGMTRGSEPGSGERR